MNSVVLTGALIRLYINNRVYKEVQQVAYNIDYGEYPIYGIDSPIAQEIAPGKITVSGSVSGVRVRHSGGLQAYDARPLILNSRSSAYISIRINDRSTGEDILFIMSAKITNQKMTIGTKGTAKLSFDFIGLVPLEPLDRAF
jgi:hypothetical protein